MEQQTGRGEALSKQDIVTLALHELGGETEAVDTEDVAIAAHRRAPVAFGWRKHTEHIDLERVRITLLHEAESANPRLAGSVRIGWHLTPVGVAWLSEHAGRVRQAAPPGAASAKVAARRAETRHSGAEADRLRSTPAFHAWSAGQEVSTRDAAAVFRIDHYTSERDRHLKTRRLRLLVDGDPELSAFVDAMSPLAIGVQRPSGRPAVVTSTDPAVNSSPRSENGGAS